MVYKENKFSLLIFLVVVALALGQDTNPSAGIDYKVQNENAQKVYIQPTPPNVPTTTPAPTTTSTTPQPITTQSTTPQPKPTQPTPPPTKPSTTTTSTTTTTTTQKPTTTPATTTTSTTTTTTTPTTTTTMKPTTPPPETKDDWYIKGDDGNICILAHMQFDINVQYPAKNKTLLYKDFKFSKISDANATGSCSTINDQQKLELTFTNDITAELVFAENKSDNTYSWKSLHLNIPTKYLNESNFTVPDVPLTSNGELFIVPLNRSFTCASWKDLHMDSSVANTTATVKITNARLEAFGTIKNQSYSAGIDCSPQTPDIVPIVVGLILAGLVVVVLVAYLIGRRRAQARGYLSM